VSDEDGKRAQPLRTADLDGPFEPNPPGAVAPSEETTAPLDKEQPAVGAGAAAALASEPAREPTVAAGGATRTLGGPGGGATIDGDEGGRYTHLIDTGVFARGGFGSLHATHDTRLLRTVAMKVLENENPRAAARFLQEGQVTAQLEHPNIPSVHEAGNRPGGQPFFTMQLVRGDTLTDLLKDADFENDASGALYTFLQIFQRMCDALSFAHARGVIHRDLKPDNIMVGSHGQVYVMDWGIALVTGEPGVEGADPDEPMVRRQVNAPLTDKQGTVVGTPSYMAPEQATGRLDRIDERTDVFSLGAILYYALTGTAPYRGKTSQEKLLKAQACAVERLEVRAPDRRIPPGLRQITMRALSESPERRYQTARELKEDIERFLRGGWWFETRTFAPGDVILEEGGPADAAYIITGGSAEVYRALDGGEDRLTTMGPGDVFGETAILTDTERSASVRALSPLTTMVVTRESIDEWFSDDSWMGQIVQSLARRFREMEAVARRPREEADRSAGERSVRPAMAAPQAAAPRIALPTSRRLAAETTDAGAGGSQASNPFGDDDGSILESGTVPVLIDALTRGGDLAQAARLYEQSAGDLGPALLEWACTVDSAQARNLAQMLARARDFASAARAYQIVGDFNAAIPLFRKADDWRGVGDCFVGLGDRAHAAEAFERAGDVDAAIELWDELGNPAKRAEVLMRAGRFFDAAAVYREHNDLLTELALLRRVPLHDAHRVEASLRLASLMMASRHFEDAVAVLSDTLAAWHDTHSGALLADALVQVYEAMGRREDGERVREWIAELRERDEQERSLDHSIHADLEAEAADHASLEIANAVERSRPPADGWEELKGLGVFGELSLADLKDLFARCEQRDAAVGSVLIEGRAEVGGLYVVLAGEADVIALEDGAVVNVVGKGATLGEVSLLREGGATARVVARSALRTLFIARDRFEDYCLGHPGAALAIYEHFARTLAERVTALTR
jgi:serine/threonine-protein kinase